MSASRFSIALLMLGACGDDTDDTGTRDGGTVDPFCESAPIATWQTFGKGFLVQDCQPCHGSLVDERYGAPDAVVFDTEADASQHADRILAVATGEDPTMPPEGGVSEDDRYYLEVWLRCYPPSS